VNKNILGIHHITAIAADPQRNLDFYTGVLGLRLVKLTVNFDDPGSYHFYFGDELGHPGTILTFFPWPNARRGRRGNGQAAIISYSIPEGAMGYWRERLRHYNVTESSQPQARFDEEVLAFLDPDGLQLELVAHAGAQAIEPWQGGPVPPEQALRSFYGVTLWEEGFESTAQLLTDTMGFRSVAEDRAGKRYRFTAEGERLGQNPGQILDIVCLPNGPAPLMGAGVVHHVAWRAPDDAQQRAWRAELAELGYNVTPVIDRQYFHSIYYREPGGVLFEIATDPPGFAIDEPVAELGTHLKLPPQYEPERSRLERALPHLDLGRAARPEDTVRPELGGAGSAASPASSAPRSGHER
jgi:glyoxalase family protein